MPTYGIVLIFFSKNYISIFTPLHFKFILLGVTFVFTFLLPAINAFVLLKMGRIKSLEMETAHERIIPYTSTALYYFALFYLFYNAQFPAVFRILILGAGISIVLTLLITFKWKISAHTVGIGGICGAILGLIFRIQSDMQLLFMLVILLAGIIGYSRLKLNAHSPTQVYAGFILGFFAQFILMLFY